MYQGDPCVRLLLPFCQYLFCLFILYEFVWDSLEEETFFARSCLSDVKLHYKVIII